MSGYTLEKWKPIIESINSGSSWLNHYKTAFDTGSTITNANITNSSIDWSNMTLLPVAMKIAATTIGAGGWYKSKKQQLKEDRINKIRKVQGLDPNVILPDDLYQDGLVSVKPLSAPLNQFLFIDYKYEDIKTRRKKKLIKINRIMKIKYIDEILKNNN